MLIESSTALYVVKPTTALYVVAADDLVLYLLDVIVFIASCGACVVGPLDQQQYISLCCADIPTIN